MTALRIAIISEIWTAGATRCARDLERGLSKAHEVRYYPRDGKESVDGLLADLNRFAPDVVHLHSFFGDLPYDFLATVSRRYRTCFTPHDPRPIGAMELPCWDCAHSATCFQCPLVRPRNRYLLRNPYFWSRRRKRRVHAMADDGLRVVSVSRWLLERLRRHELARFESRHIPLGINAESVGRVRDARQRLGLPTGVPVLLHVAHSGGGWTLNQRKGMPHLADAFVKRVLPRFPGAILLVAGEGLVPNHTAVRPLGFLDQRDLPTYYSAADVFVAPTLADNLPYTILEAMACETAVVASRVGGIPEQVVEGVTGGLARPADEQDLGRAILSLLSDPQACREMGRRGRQRVEEIFGMQAFLERHEQLYREMAVVRAPQTPSPQLVASRE